MLVTTFAESIRESEKIAFIDTFKDAADCLLNEFILNRGNPQRTLPAVFFIYVGTKYRLGPVTSTVNLFVEFG